MDSGQRYKGQDRVIAAITYIVAQGHDVEYVVVGEGDDRARLEELARDVGVSERVRSSAPSSCKVSSNSTA
jgi:glycosyltransferase involved in cell wall biosynthesis